MATQEQLDFRKKWVEALRSGEYKQGKHALKTVDNKYCCLGVLCEVVGASSISDGQLYSFGFDGYFESKAMLHFNIRDKVGLSDMLGGMSDDITSSLSNMNDTGKSFAEIADVIESAPPGLFKD